VVIPREEHIGDSLYIQIGGCDDIADRIGLNYAMGIVVDMEGCYQYPVWRSDEFLIPERGDVELGDLRIGHTVDLEFSGIVQDRGWRLDLCGEHDPLGVVCTHDDIPTPGGSAYFSIADALLTARRYADSNRDDDEDDGIGMEWVEYPQAGTSQHDISNHRIFLGSTSGFEDGEVIHEYGHHLTLKISKRPGTPTGSHNYCDANDEGFAWREGFPDYLGTIVPYRNPYDPASPSNHYLDGPAVGYGDIEDPYCTQVSETVEAGIASVLWDLVDDPATFAMSNNEAFDDTLDGYEDLIFAIFDSDLDETFADIADNNPNICDFIDAFRRRSGASDDDIDDILDEYDVDC